MKVLEELNYKRTGVYLRKESVDENITTGYGRLQWLKHEFEDYKGYRKFFIDEPNENSNLLSIIDDIKSGKLEAIIIWTLRDIDLDMILSFLVTCFMNGIAVVSFYEGVIETKDIINTYTDQFSITK